MAEIRTIRAAEWPEALELWTTVFGVGSWLFQSLHDGTPDRSWDHVQVVVEDGHVVAAVDVFMRVVRDAGGSCRKLGGIGSVATREQHRGKGYSRALLTNAIEMMEREGCECSMLFTGINAFYEKLGWKTTPLRSRRGQVVDPARFVGAIDVSVMTKQTGWPLAKMAEIHEAFNETRPLSCVRPELMWETAGRERLERPERRVWGANRRADLLGYLVASMDDHSCVLEELCVYPGERDIAGALTQEFAREAQRIGLERIEVLLPDDPNIDGAVAEILDQPITVMRSHVMTRPIGEGFGWDEVDAMFAPPWAAHYELDNF